MKKNKFTLYILCLILCLCLFCISADAKLFGKKDNVNSVEQFNQEENLKDAKEVKEVGEITENIIPDEAEKAKEIDTPAVEINEKSTDKETSDDKKFKLFKKREKVNKYLIPVDQYMPVGAEQNVTKIEGSVSKTINFGLDECLELALQNNPKIKSAFSQAEATKTQIAQAWANYSPQVNISASISRQKPNMGFFSSDAYSRYLLGDISVSQLVYDFGVTQNQVTIKKLDYEQTKSAIDKTVNEVIYQVKDAYYYLIYQIQAEKVAADTVQKFQQHLRQAQSFYEIGTKPKIDVTIAEVNLYDAKLKLIEAQNNVDIAVASLNNAMGTPHIEKYIPNDTLTFNKVDIDMKKAIQIANESHPDLKTAKIQADAAEQYIKLAKKSFLPTIQAEAGYSLGGRTFTDPYGWDVGGYVNFPLINPVLIKKQIDEAKALYRKQEFDSLDTVNNVYLEIQQAYIKLVDKTQQVPVAKEAVRQAKENYELSQGRYRVGVGEAIELKDSEIQYQDAQLTYLNALYQYNSAKALLEKAIGRTLKSDEPFDKELKI